MKGCENKVYYEFKDIGLVLLYMYIWCVQMTICVPEESVIKFPLKNIY